MSYLVIAFVIALVIAPVLALKPSQRQKQLAAMRERARQLGLQVQICPLPQTHRQRVRREEVVSGVAYRLLWRHPQARTISFEYLWMPEESEPNSAPEAILSALQLTLENLPLSAWAIEFNPMGVGIYWKEVGDTQVVELLAAQLTALKGQLESLSVATGLPLRGEEKTGDND